MFEREEEAEKKKKQEEDEQTTVIQTDEAMAKAVLGLLKTPDPDLMSELTPDQHRAMAGLAMRATKYNIHCLQTYLESWLKLNVSNGRKGRHEIKEIATAIRAEESRQGKLDKLRSMFGMGNEFT